MADQPNIPLQPQPAQTGQMPAIDSSDVETVYVNFFLLSGNADEVLLDVGLFSQVVGPSGPEPVDVTHRIVMNYRNAKLLAELMRQVVARHEQAFGVVETDVNRRLRAAQQQRPPQG